MTEVVLKEGQCAERGKCGSCHFFDRDHVPEVREIRGGPPGEEAELWYGRCDWNPPPWLLHTLRTVLGWTGSRKVQDTDSCSNWCPSGHTYVRPQRWKVDS